MDIAAYYATPCGTFMWSNQEVVFRHGMHAGRTLRDVAVQEPSYMNYMMSRVSLVISICVREVTVSGLC